MDSEEAGRGPRQVTLFWAISNARISQKSAAAMGYFSPVPLAVMTKRGVPAKRALRLP